MTASDCTGVILAGGRSRRFSGENKAFLKVGGRRILDRMYGVFSAVFDTVALSANAPLEYLAWDAMIFTDVYPARSSLTGLHAGLFYAATPYVFFGACDTPFLRKELVEAILDRMEPGCDALIPETSAGLEPLCAVYAKTCLNAVARRLEDEDFKIRSFFKQVRMKTITERALRETDPGLVSFFNVNTPRDLVTAESVLASAAR